MKKHVGFTGTRRGMTDAQADTVAGILTAQPEGTVYHHGDCLGADAQFHRLARVQPGAHLHGHPPDRDNARAFCSFDSAEKPKPYLIRNRDIVDSSDLMVATPGETAERLRSGTWATVRYARTKECVLLVVNPDGSILHDD